jgi:copper chaperone CopZ
MKTIIPALLGLIVVGGLVASMALAGPPVAAESPATAAAVEAGETLTLTVKGWHCGGCMDATIRKVQGVDGVLRVSGDLENEQLTVVYDAERTGEDAIRGAVTDSGFQCE